MIQWHPIFVNILRNTLSEQDFSIEEEVSVGDLPLKIDVVVIKEQKLDVYLPEIFWYYKKYNLIQFKAPNDSFSPDDYEKLLCYGILFKLKYGVKSREDITLTANIPTFSRKLRDYFQSIGFDMQQVRKGVYKIKAEFEIVIFARQELEIIPLNYPLLVFSRGKQLMKFLSELIRVPEEIELIKTAYSLYPDLVKEVFKVQKLNYSEVGIDVDKVINAMIRDFGEDKIIQRLGEDKIIQKLGEDKIIQRLGEDKIIQRLGEDKVIQRLGEKRALKGLIKMVGKDKIKHLLDE